MIRDDRHEGVTLEIFRIALFLSLGFEFNLK